MASDDGVEILLGNQRTAVIALAVPLGIALFIQQIKFRDLCKAVVFRDLLVHIGARARSAVGGITLDDRAVYALYQIPDQLRP